MTTKIDHSRKDIDYHDNIARQYDGVVNDPRWSSINSLFRPLKRHLPANKVSMLDVRTGTGHMLLRYARQFESVIAIDHSDGMLNVARESLAKADITNVSFVKTDAIDYLESNNARFDMITCVGFLHHLHLAELGKLLTLLRRAIAPEGRLIIAEPIVTDAVEPGIIKWWNRLYRMNPHEYAGGGGEDPDEAPLHLEVLLKAVSMAGFRKIAEGSGWEIFPRKNQNRIVEKLGIEVLHRLFGHNGPVHWICCEPQC